MSDAVKSAPQTGPPGAGGVSAPTWASRWRRIRGPAIFSAAALALIWGALPWAPAAWGIRFGTPYLMFFTLAALGAAAFFALLNWGPIRPPASAAMTFGSILLVYAATVGGMVVFGYWYYPQFETPKTQFEAPRLETPGGAAAKPAADAAEQRGKAVFLSPQFGCFACHTIESFGIRGGQRGPDMSSAGRTAASRRPGVSPEDYLRESIVDPWTCFSPLPASGLSECQKSADPAKTYPQLMPPYKDRLSEGELADLVAFLMSLKGAREHDARHN